MLEWKHTLYSKGAHHFSCRMAVGFEGIGEAVIAISEKVNELMATENPTASGTDIEIHIDPPEGDLVGLFPCAGSADGDRNAVTVLLMGIQDLYDSLEGQDDTVFLELAERIATATRQAVSEANWRYGRPTVTVAVE